MKYPHYIYLSIS